MDIREFGRERTRQATTLVAIGSVLGVGTVFGVAAADIAATKAAAASAGTSTSSGTTQLPQRRSSSDDGTFGLGLPGSSSQPGTSSQSGTSSGANPVQPGTGSVPHGFSAGS